MGLRFATVVARGASARKLGDVGGNADEPGCSAQTLVGLSVRESVPETRDRLKQSGLQEITSEQKHHAPIPMGLLGVDSLVRNARLPNIRST